MIVQVWVFAPKQNEKSPLHLFESSSHALTQSGNHVNGLLRERNTTSCNFHNPQPTNTLHATINSITYKYGAKTPEWAVSSTLELVPWGGAGKTLDASPFLFPPPCPAHTTPSSSDCSCTHFTLCTFWTSENMQDSCVGIVELGYQWHLLDTPWKEPRGSWQLKTNQDFSKNPTHTFPFPLRNTLE